MHLKNIMLSLGTAVCLSSCVSAPQIDLCSVDFDSETQLPYLTCSPGDGSSDYTRSMIEGLGYMCMAPEHFADTKAYLRHLLRELDSLEVSVEK